MKKEKTYNEAVDGDEGFVPGEGYPSCDGEPCANVSDDSQDGTDTMADAKGKEFDADLCEAVAKFAAGEEMQGKVVDIVQTGYMLGDKVLRFAKVVVGE